MALQREGRIHVRQEMDELGVRVGICIMWVTRAMVATAKLHGTYMTSVWWQEAPGGVTFKLWMCLG